MIDTPLQINELTLHCGDTGEITSAQGGHRTIVFILETHCTNTNTKIRTDYTKSFYKNTEIIRHDVLLTNIKYFSNISPSVGPWLVASEELEELMSLAEVRGLREKERAGRSL